MFWASYIHITDTLIFCLLNTFHGLLLCDNCDDPKIQQSHIIVKKIYQNAPYYVNSITCAKICNLIQPKHDLTRAKKSYITLRTVDKSTMHLISHQ